jgi:RNA polymerase sigma factor (sigma-70 family)
MIYLICGLNFAAWIKRPDTIEFVILLHVPSQPMSKSSNVSHWIDLVKAGDSAAADRIWKHYFDRLVRSVRGRLYGQNRAVSDEEDIVLSVFDSFYNAAEAGRFPDLTDRDDLWRLLLRMSARKVVDKRRHDERQKRGGNVKVHSLNQAGDDETVIEAIGDEPSPDMVLMMQESVEQFFSHLGGGQLRDLAVAKLEGYSNAEIAKRFGCSERTVERRLHLIREKCQQELIDDEHPSEQTTDRGSGAD